MGKTEMVIRQDDVKIRKKSPPPAKAHKNAKAYRRKNKHPKRDSSPDSGPSNGWAAFI